MQQQLSERKAKTYEIQTIGNRTYETVARRHALEDLTERC